MDVEILWWMAGGLLLPILIWLGIDYYIERRTPPRRTPPNPLKEDER